jgi:hypothetical protein
MQAQAPRRHRRRTWLLGFLALIVVVGLFVLLLLRAAGPVRRDLERARSALEHGRDQLLAGYAMAAAASFEEGRELFSNAAHASRGPVLQVTALLPIAGRTIDAVRGIAEAGTRTAEGANVLATALANVPGGPAGLAPSNGVLHIERIPRLAEAAKEADVLIMKAQSRLAEAPHSLLIGPVAAARRTAEEELQELSDKVHAASSVLRGLPGFLGDDGPRRYFFGAQNPAELRGTGGLIGAYSILRIDDGSFHFGPLVPVSSLPATRLDQIPPPNDDYAANYNRFRGGTRLWTAINVMPDFPSVAKEILNSYQAAAGERLDGVILADPFALAALLKASGPVELPGHGIIIDAGNVVSFTTNEAYSLLTDPTARKRLLGEVAKAAFGRFIAQPSADLQDMKLLLQAAADRHILAYSTNRFMEQGLLATPVGGALDPPSSQGDLVSVVVNSAAGSKVDFYQDRDIRYSVALGEDGSARARIELTLTNRAPTSGQPAYVIGPIQASGRVGPILKTLEPGESVALVNVYCGPDCLPGEALLDEAPTTVGSAVDLGMRYVQDYYAIPSGEERSLKVSWDDPRAWFGNSSGGVYQLTFANQVTIRPTTVRIHIEAPSGMRIVSASNPLRIVDGSALYEGEPGPELDLSVRFAPPLPVRLWRNVIRFLDRPVF